MKTIAILSSIIVVTPFLGIPGSWETFIIVALGLIIFLKSFYSYRMTRDTSKDFSTASFKQNAFDNSNEEEVKKEEEVREVEISEPEETENHESEEETEGTEEVIEKTEDNLFEDEEK